MDTGEINRAEQNSGGIAFQPIGVIRSEHRLAAETPIQPVFARGSKGCVELHTEFLEGLRALEGFSHVFLLYHFHRCEERSLTATPFLSDEPKGVFATRSPKRPNPIGMSLVRLVRIEGNRLNLEDVDILDGTPLLDIKPYVPRFDQREGARGGWTEAVDDETSRKRGRRGWRGGEPR